LGTIGYAFGLTRERVRQIVLCAKQKAAEKKPFSLDARCEDVLQLSVRAQRFVDSNGIETVRDLLTFAEVDLLRAPNLGRITLRQVAAELARYGHCLGELDQSQRGNDCGAREALANDAETVPGGLPHEGS
jgi:DNA-directed RNA polymerase alpha subunit